MKEIINGLKQIKTRVDSGAITTVNGTETLLSKQLAKMIEAAINYTHCSTQLKDENIPTFEQWKKILYTPYQKGLYINKPGLYLKDEETLLRIYKAELNL